MSPLNEYFPTCGCSQSKSAFHCLMLYDDLALHHNLLLHSLDET